MKIKVFFKIRIIHTFKTTIDANLELKLDDEKKITDYEVVNVNFDLFAGQLFYQPFSRNENRYYQPWF